MTTPRGLEADLAAWGKVIVIETSGRDSGRPRTATVGFIDDGGEPRTLRVAASDENTHWALNLLVEPACVVVEAGERVPYQATPLTDAERHATAAELILKYGTPSERLGGGPAFRLVRRPRPATS